MEQWSGKVAVVTGAGSGIGAALYRDLADAGMTAIGLDYNEEKIKVMTEEITLTDNFNKIGMNGQLHAIKCDISKPEQVVETFKEIEKKFGGVDVLVNNAGICIDGLISGGSIDNFKTVIDTNVLGVVACTSEVVKSIKSRKVRGHIVNLNSISGHYVPALPDPRLNVYIATKHAVTAITEVLRREFRHLNLPIKVTSVSPGLVKTNVFEASGVKMFDEEFFKTNPILDVKDVSNAVLYSLSTPPNVQVHEITLHALHELY